MRPGDARDKFLAHFRSVHRNEVISHDRATALIAAIGRGIGRRSEAERADLLLQGSADDLFSAALVQMSDRDISLASVI